MGGLGTYVTWHILESFSSFFLYIVIHDVVIIAVIIIIIYAEIE